MLFVFYNMVSRYTDTEKVESKDVRACVTDFNDDNPEVVRPPGEKLHYLQEQGKYYCSGKSGARPSNPCGHLTGILLMILLIHINRLDEVIDKMSP